MTGDPTGEQRAEEERERLNARAMELLTAGLTSQGDVFLIGVLAVLVMIGLYPLVGAWSLLAFPLVFVAAVLTRGLLHRRRRARVPDA
jgi:hypothetical protein